MTYDFFSREKPSIFFEFIITEAWNAHYVCVIVIDRLFLILLINISYY